MYKKAQNKVIFVNYYKCQDKPIILWHNINLFYKFHYNHNHTKIT